VSIGTGQSSSGPVYIKANSTAGGFLYLNASQSGSSNGFQSMLNGYSSVPVVP
jgi:hypothetical protein